MKPPTGSTAIAVLFGSIVLAGAGGLGRAAPVVPPKNSAVEGDRAELAIYVTFGGTSERLDLAAAGAPVYPQRSARKNLEPDVDVVCSGPGQCLLAGAPEDAEIGAPAIVAATHIATSNASYPLNVTVSFRVLVVPRPIIHWAPEACPADGQKSEVNQRLEREFLIAGSCVGHLSAAEFQRLLKMEKR
jgi:hypothetical protein